MGRKATDLSETAGLPTSNLKRSLRTGERFFYPKLESDSMHSSN